MTSFSKQFRANIAKPSLESLEDGTPAMPAEQVEAVLAEPVATEIEQEIVAPAGDMELGADTVIDAEADANTLDTTAEILEGTVEPLEGETAEGPGVDPAGAEIAEMTLERISNKYGMDRKTMLSQEAYATPKSRQEFTRALAKEAAENAQTLRTKVTEAVQKFIKWITDLIKSIFDKRTKLANRVAALKTKVKAISGKQAADAKISFGGSGAMLDGKVATEPATVVEALPAFIKGFSEVETYAAAAVGKDDAKGTDEGHDFNPKQLGGYTLKSATTDGKLVVSKEATGDTKSVEIKALDQNDMIRTVVASEVALKALAEGEASLKKVVAEMNKGMGILRSVATGNDKGDKAPRAAILARYTGVSKLSGYISGTALSVVSTCLSAVEKSAATFKAA